jgi:hypothetical protein
LSANVYQRWEDRDKGPSGVPDLPPKWKPYVLENPISGKIVEVSKDGTAILNLGLRDGVFEGMELTVQAYAACTALVISVAERSCVVTSDYADLNDDGFKKNRKVASRRFAE